MRAPEKGHEKIVSKRTKMALFGLQSYRILNTPARAGLHLNISLTQKSKKVSGWRTDDGGQLTICHKTSTMSRPPF
jgi:hypothetical protein